MEHVSDFLEQYFIIEEQFYKGKVQNKVKLIRKPK